MADNLVYDNRDYDIPVAFHFKVEFGLSPEEVDVRFQEVNGLSAEVVTEELREGGVNDYAHHLPTGVKHGNLVLKRGYIDNSRVGEWCRSALEDFDFNPVDVNVILLDEEHKPLAKWVFTRAYPLKWSISEFNAQQNTLVIESLELVYAKFRKQQIP